MPLRRCRQELEEAGCSFRLPCGNMIFVYPSQYHDARKAALPDTRLKHDCFYAIVVQSLEYLVEECLADIGKGA